MIKTVKISRYKSLEGGVDNYNISIRKELHKNLLFEERPACAGGVRRELE